MTTGALRWNVWGPPFRSGGRTIVAEGHHLTEAQARALAARRNADAARHGGGPDYYVVVPVGQEPPGVRKPGAR